MVKIDDINREMTNYKIKVQVMKKWNIQSGKKISAIEMVLVDEDGTRIQASIDEAYVKIFEGKIVESSSDKRLTCTLWNDFGKEVIDYVGANKERKIICVVNFACVNEWKDVFSISNSYNATQLLFDPPTPQVEDFISRLPNDDTTITCNDSSSSSANKVDWDDEFLKKNKKKTIQELHRISRYKIVMFVTDDSNTCEAKLIVFDTIAAPFLRIPAVDLANEVAEEAPSVLPEALRNMIGKELLLKISFAEENLRSSKISLKVDLISDDKLLLERFKARDAIEPIIDEESEPSVSSTSSKAMKRSSNRSMTTRSNKKTKTGKNV
ncbi:unnamed protein product [Microthlaspi erraticum]|uniref:Replication protein A 70 kDa DNA-binding subunit B/D first OB fold domain-containing protein n=1 Tax=Microthlaspi erraticum TaxID=1685480 RepID=A0A6D2J778_9BRAS|nr:unnamed protein product [Microthlaspi erraticum]